MEVATEYYGNTEEGGQALFGKLAGFMENILPVGGEVAILNSHIISPTLR